MPAEKELAIFSSSDDSVLRQKKTGDQKRLNRLTTFGSADKTLLYYRPP
jgi:hypothetical protein